MGHFTGQISVNSKGESEGGENSEGKAKRENEPQVALSPLGQLGLWFLPPFASDFPLGEGPQSILEELLSLHREVDPCSAEGRPRQTWSSATRIPF